MPFKSKRQWRWAFANRESWARKWAHATSSFRSLPNRVSRRKKRKRG